MKQKIESTEFFDLMQQYRIAPMENQALVIKCFESVKSFLIAPDTATKEQAPEPSTPVLEGKAEFMLVLNEGTEDETTISLAGYINLFDEDMDDDFIKVVNLKIGEKYQYGADEIKRIANK